MIAVLIMIIKNRTSNEKNDKGTRSNTNSTEGGAEGSRGSEWGSRACVEGLQGVLRRFKVFLTHCWVHKYSPP